MSRKPKRKKRSLLGALTRMGKKRAQPVGAETIGMTDKEFEAHLKKKEKR